VGYGLFALAVVNVILGAVFLALSMSGPPERRGFASLQVFVNLGFAVVNGILGLVLVMRSRSS
jgi:hypothetical protein